nr:xylulose kinase-1 [Tanacetum cinerariifolium]
MWLLVTSVGRVIFCWLIVIPAGDLVPASGLSFLLVAMVTIHFCWSCDFLIVVSFSCWYALTANPTINASLVRQFWGLASDVSLPDGVKGLVATIDGNAYTITEASIRSALQLDDLNAINILTNAKNFDGLRDIGYATKGKFTFFKNKFSPQWKFLIHTLIHCLSPKSGSWNQFANNCEESF